MGIPGLQQKSIPARTPAMKSQWNDAAAQELVAAYAAKGVGPDIALRVYTTRLLGRDPLLVLHAGAWGCPHWGFPEARACLAAKTQGGEAGRGRKLAALAAALLSFEFSKRAYLIGNAWNGCTPGAFIARQSSTIG